MEVINWREEDGREGNSVLAWAIISLMSEAAKGSAEWESKFGGADATKLEIECRINGVEVSFTKLLERFASCWDEEVAKAAHKLAEEKFNGLYDTIERCRRELREILKLREE